MMMMMMTVKQASVCLPKPCHTCHLSALFFYLLILLHEESQVLKCLGGDGTRQHIPQPWTVTPTRRTDPTDWHWLGGAIGDTCIHHITNLLTGVDWGKTVTLPHMTAPEWERQCDSSMTTLNAVKKKKTFTGPSCYTFCQEHTHKQPQKDPNRLKVSNNTQADPDKSKHQKIH